MFILRYTTFYTRQDTVYAILPMRQLLPTPKHTLRHSNIHSFMTTTKYGKILIIDILPRTMSTCRPCKRASVFSVSLYSFAAYNDMHARIIVNNYVCYGGEKGKGHSPSAISIFAKVELAPVSWNRLGARAGSALCHKCINIGLYGH